MHVNTAAFNLRLVVCKALMMPGANSLIWRLTRANSLIRRLTQANDLIWMFTRAIFSIWMPPPNPLAIVVCQYFKKKKMEYPNTFPVWIPCEDRGRHIFEPAPTPMHATIELSWYRLPTPHILHNLDMRMWHFPHPTVHIHQNLPFLVCWLRGILASCGESGLSYLSTSLELANETNLVQLIIELNVCLCFVLKGEQLERRREMGLLGIHRISVMNTFCVHVMSL